MTAERGEFRELVEAYQHRVFRLVCSVLGPYRDADAEDVTQEVFLRVYRQLGQFRGDASLGTWIYRIARNLAIDTRRQARFRLPHLTEAALERMPAPADSTVDRAVIAAALESLPEVYRTLLYLYYWQDASVEEAAEVTGLPPGTVKSYLARGRHRIEAELAKRGVHSHG